MTPLDDGAAPCVLGDPEPLRQALLALMNSISDSVVRFRPRQPYLVARRGRLGRVSHDEVLVGVEVVRSADEQGAGHFSVNIFHPDQWPGAAGCPIPSGSALLLAEGAYFSFDLDRAASPARAANDIGGVCLAVFGDALGPEWQVSVDDLA